MRILFVCTGNVCRSPVAEHVLRARLRGWSRYMVESAGTQAKIGMAMAEESAALARHYGAAGVDPRRHRARLLTGPLLEGCDLILTMTREHRRHAVGLAPRQLGRTYTVREFAELLDSLDAATWSLIAAEPTAPERWGGLIQAIASARYVNDPVSNEDIADPLGKGDASYQLFADQLLPALSSIERVLGRVESGVDSVGDRAMAP